MIDASNLTFPVLRVNKKNVQRYSCLQELLVQSDFFLSRGAFQGGTFVVDATGAAYEVAGVDKKRKSLSWRYWGAKNPAWVLKVALSRSRTFSIEELRELLVDTVTANGWHTQSDLSKAEFVKYLEGARSIPELIERISFYGHW